jgi:hypothetical protein
MERSSTHHQQRLGEWLYNSSGTLLSAAREVLDHY